MEVFKVVDLKTGSGLTYLQECMRAKGFKPREFDDACLPGRIIADNPVCFEGKTIWE
jgi:hypothetical protein